MFVKFPKTKALGYINRQLVAKFNDDSFYPQIRQKYFTMIDWFSFVGGILGLFFGFSFLSAFEVIFHVTRGIFEKILSTVFRMERNILHSDGIREYFRKFLNLSSIHSFSYIGKDDLNKLER